MAFTPGGVFSKHVLIIVNVLFFILGLAMTVVGIWVLTDKKSFDKVSKIAEKHPEVDDALLVQPVAKALLAAGIFTMIVAFLGCCGAIKENKVMLTIYIVVLAIILIIELACGIAVAAYSDKVKEKVGPPLKNSLTDIDSNVMSVWNAIQANFTCCGVYGPGDYPDTKVEGGNDYTKAKLPPSCCNDGVTCSSTSSTAFKNGCLDALVEKIEKHMPVVIGLAITFAVVELVGIICAIILCRSDGKVDGMGEA